MATSSIPEGMNEKEYYETVVSEEEFLRWYKEQDHPTYENPSVTTDMVAYCFVEGRLKLLVIRRKPTLVSIGSPWLEDSCKSTRMLSRLVSAKFKKKLD